MTTNINAKKRLTQLLIAFVILCMTVTGVAFLLKDGIKSASARTVSIKSESDWNLFADSYNSGDIINATLTDNIVASAKLRAIKPGVTVNLNMNGKSITWDVTKTDSRITADSYASGSYAEGTYWGLITNNGTLNITGTGTIRNKKIAVYEEYKERDNCPQRVATIVNNGSMILGGGITIEAYLTNYNYRDVSGVAWNNKSYNDTFLYCCGVYNNGTALTSSANITSGSMVAAPGAANHASWIYSISYGIYDLRGNVITKGGKIYAESNSGNHRSSNDASDEGHHVAISVGVYSNGASILGSTSIETYSRTWQSQDNNGTWKKKNAIDLEYSAGVMYTGKNYPLIGAAVNITSSFHMIVNDETVAVPGEPSQKFTVKSADDPYDYARRAYPVVGVTANRNTIGTHSSEKIWKDDGWFFGSNTSNSSNDIEKAFGYSSSKYIAEDAYYDGRKTNDSDLIDCKNTYRRETGQRNGETAVAKIVNGVPSIGNGTIYGNLTTPAENGSQYVIVYRYFDNNMNAANFNSVSYTYDSGKQSSRASVVINNTNTTNGLVPGDQKITAVNGGASRNNYYYKFESITFERVTSGAYASRIINNDKDQMRTMWGGALTTEIPDTGLAPSATQTIVIYMNYILKQPSAVRVAVADKGVGINKYTETTDFTATYTGATLVPGTDFDIGIIDMGADKELSINDVEDDTPVTNVYNTRGNGSGSGNNATAVTYRHTTDATPTSSSTWVNGLPKDAGKYTIEVKVNPDTTFAATGTYNRLGTTQYVTCTITKANVTIDGASSKSGTYGSNLNTLVPFDSYTVSGVNNEKPSGTWSFDQGFKGTDYVNAGTYNLNLVWTPTPGTASEKNYNPTVKSVTLIVAKRSVNVNIGASRVGYGDTTVRYSLAFENLATCDNAKVSAWEKATTGQINYNNEWVQYSAGVPMGIYEAKILTFGGAADNNNDFHLNTKYGTLDVGKRILYYTAEATDRAYIPGNNNVDVKLTYQSGAVDGDTVPQEINNVIGVMSNPNAGEGKNVTVDVEKIVSAISNNYQLVIENATSLTVNIRKAIPAGVACAVDPAALPYTYSVEKTLSDVALKPTNQGVSGSWSWKDASIIPTCDVTAYTAVFTPADAMNYESIEQAVSFTVEQKEVIVTIPAQTLTYGDAQPALAGLIRYTGFTGEDSRKTVSTTGEVKAVTDYTRGADVGSYTITITSDLTSTNYKFTAQNSSINVNKKALVIKALDQTVTYGDNPPQLDTEDVVATGFYGTHSLVSGALDGTLAVTTTYTYGAGVGTYKIHVSGVTAKNYDITFEDGDLTVEPAVLTVKTVAKTVPYGTTVQNEDYEYTITGYVGNDSAGDVSITTEPNFITLYRPGNSVGVYTVTPDVTQMSTANYTFKAESENLTVVKATPSISNGKPTADIVHGQPYSEAVINADNVTVINSNNNAVVSGTFTLADSSTIADRTGGNVILVSYIFTPDDDINYTTTTIDAFLSIAEKEISGDPIIRGSVMVGEQLTVDLSAMDPNDANMYTYQWYKGNAEITGANSATYVISETDKGSKIHVVVTAVSNSGYTGSVPSGETAKVIISLKAASATQFHISIPATEEYDGSTREAIVNVRDEYVGSVGSYIVKYNGSTTKPKDAGTYVVTLDVEAPDVGEGEYVDGLHYGPVSGLEIGSFSITKKTYYVSVEANDKVYDGSRAATAKLIEGGAVANDDVKVASGYSFYFDNVNVGERNILVSGLKLTGKDAANYNIDIQSSTANITPATLTARVMGIPKVYDGSTSVDVRFTNISGYVGGDSESTVYIVDGRAYAERADAGSDINIFNITYALYGASSGNYVLEIVNQGTVDITPAVPSVVAPFISGIIYDSARTLGNIDLSVYTSAAGSWRFDNPGIVPTVAVKRYAATFYSSSGNYSDYKAEITINVVPKEVIISANDTFVKYGQSAPSFTYEVDGLTGMDTLEDIGGAGVSATTTYTMGQPVGNYAITLDAHFDSDNYTFVTQNGVLAVTPATLVVSATADDKVYNGDTEVNVRFSIVSGKYVNDTIALTYSSVTGNSATANAGISTVNYEAPEIVGQKASNYEIYVTPASNVLTVNIAKANVDNVVFPTEGEVQFGYDLTHVKFATEGVGNGTFAYENAKGTIPGNIGVYGTYKVIFTPEDSRNYNTKEAIVTLTVVKCKLDYVVGIAGTAQEDQKLSASITGMPSLAGEYIQYQWYRVSDKGAFKIEGATESTYTATSEDIGYTLLVVTYFPSDAPYVFADTADVVPVEENVEGIIGQMSSAIQAIKLSFWQRLMDWLYRLIAAITGIRLG